MEILFPLEFVVQGTPVSSQASGPSRDRWKRHVKAAASAALPPDYFSSQDRISVQIYFFPAGRMQGDLDNIVKYVLDAMVASVFVDDDQVDRIVVQRFFERAQFPGPLEGTILQALSSTDPMLYVRVTNEPLKEFRP